MNFVRRGVRDLHGRPTVDAYDPDIPIARAIAGERDARPFLAGRGVVALDLAHSADALARQRHHQLVTSAGPDDDRRGPRAEQVVIDAGLGDLPDGAELIIIEDAGAPARLGIGAAHTAGDRR